MAGSRTKENGIIALTSATDLTSYKGYGVTVQGGSIALGGGFTANTSTFACFGVIVEGQSTYGQNSVAPLTSGEVVKVKLAAGLQTAGVTIGALLGMISGGSFTICASTSYAHAQALETGASGELIDAILMFPGKV